MKHRAPSLLRRINTPTRGKTDTLGVCCGLVLGVGLAFAVGTALGDAWTPVSQATPTLPPPLSDDPGQRGLRGLPTPVRIFDDRDVPHYEPETPARVTSAPLSAYRPPAHVPVTPTPTPAASESPSTAPVQPTEPAPPAPEPAPEPQPEPAPPVDLPGIPDDTPPATEPDTEEEPVPDQPTDTEPETTETTETTEEVAGP